MKTPNVTINENHLAVKKPSFRELLWCLLHSQRLSQFSVSLRVFLFEIPKMGAPVGDHLKQPPLGMHIFFMGFQVLTKLANTLGQNGNLNLRRARITFARLVFFDNVFFFAFVHHECNLSTFLKDLQAPPLFKR